MKGKPMAAPSFAKDIRPLFTDEDVKHMSFAFDLSSFADVKANSPAILDRVGRAATDPLLMPPAPRGPWSAAWVQLFKDWIAGGFQP
jgi:hypothetical protein